MRCRDLTGSELYECFRSMIDFLQRRRNEQILQVEGRELPYIEGHARHFFDHDKDKYVAYLIRMRALMRLCNRPLASEWGIDSKTVGKKIEKSFFDVAATLDLDEELCFDERSFYNRLSELKRV